jgi:hypothetical protein
VSTSAGSVGWENRSVLRKFEAAENVAQEVGPVSIRRDLEWEE